MKVVEILKLGREFLKMMSRLDLRRDDYRYIGLYERYMNMRDGGEKVDYILHILSEEYGISESTIKRVVKRLSGEVKS